MDCKDDFVDTLLSLARHNMQDTVHTLAAADIQMRRLGLLLGRELIEGEPKGLENGTSVDRDADGWLGAKGKLDILGSLLETEDGRVKKDGSGRVGYYSVR